MEDFCTVLNNHMDKLVLIALLLVILMGDMVNLKTITNDPVVLASAVLCGVYVNYTTESLKIALASGILVILLTSQLLSFPVVENFSCESNKDDDDDEDHHKEEDDKDQHKEEHDEKGDECKNFGNPENLFDENAVNSTIGENNFGNLKFWGNTEKCCSKEMEPGMSDNQKAACAISGHLNEVSQEVINNYVEAASASNKEPPCASNAESFLAISSDFNPSNVVEGYVHQPWSHDKNLLALS